VIGGKKDQAQKNRGFKGKKNIAVGARGYVPGLSKKMKKTELLEGMGKGGPCWPGVNQNELWQKDNQKEKLKRKEGVGGGQKPRMSGRPTKGGGRRAPHHTGGRRKKPLKKSQKKRFPCEKESRKFNRMPAGEKRENANRFQVGGNPNLKKQRGLKILR